MLVARSAAFLCAIQNDSGFVALFEIVTVFLFSDRLESDLKRDDFVGIFKRMKRFQRE